MRLYNPSNGTEFETASDDPDHVALFIDAGWEQAPEPEQRPGFEPEPVVYEPVAPKAVKPAKAKTEPAEDKSE